jgi:hypothetical protein
MLGSQKLGDLGQNLALGSVGIVEARSIYHSDAPPSLTFAVVVIVVVIVVVEKDLNGLALRRLW